MSLRGLARGAVNRVLSHGGVQLVRGGAPHDWSDTRTFIPLEKTLAAAKSAGLSVGDYVDTVMNKHPAATQKTIDLMTSLGVFASPIETVVEIGPGSGRYLAKTVAACHPVRYEIYETAGPWIEYLRAHHEVILQPTDGRSLAATADASADLVQAHKVFDGIPFLPTLCYWAEMARVTKPGGHVVFDAITEDCLDFTTAERWRTSGIDNGAYPAVIPRTLVVSAFERLGFDLLGTPPIPIGPGVAHLFVFRKGSGGMAALQPSAAL